jgi:site-specific recombinase XerD
LPAHRVSSLCNVFLHDLGISHTLHTLRHWFGTQTLRVNGGDLRQTQELMRHQSPVSTAIYTWVDPKAAAVTVAALPVLG